MSRIQEAIAKATTIVGKLTIAQIADVNKGFDLDLCEYMKFQELKSLAQLHNVITLEEALEVFGYLGNSNDTFNQQPLPVKIALMGLLKNLAQLRIQGLI